MCQFDPVGHHWQFLGLYDLPAGRQVHCDAVMTTKESMDSVTPRRRAIESLVCGIGIGFICGFMGAGGGMMMLLILTSVLGYELKTAVGTSVFIMTFTALTVPSRILPSSANRTAWCSSCV